MAKAKDQITLEVATPNGVFRGAFEKTAKVEEVIAAIIADHDFHSLACWLETQELALCAIHCSSNNRLPPAVPSRIYTAHFFST
jgi:hypothetical protein